jgi:hypothetical protein
MDAYGRLWTPMDAYGRLRTARHEFIKCCVRSKYPEPSRTMIVALAQPHGRTQMCTQTRLDVNAQPHAECLVKPRKPRRPWTSTDIGGIRFTDLKTASPTGTGSNPITNSACRYGWHSARGWVHFRRTPLVARRVSCTSNGHHFKAQGIGSSLARQIACSTGSRVAFTCIPAGTL